MTTKPPKPRFSFPVWGAIRLVFQVLTVGADKYDRPGRFGALDRPAEEHFDAAVRHLCEHADGITEDAGDGLPPLAHAAARLLILLTMQLREPKQPRSLGDRLDSTLG